ncbi:MAG: hypothetical protein GY745_04495 [Actinomycetia bacterium]|nr:hypothetical protein [Actinomycetes bacterium]
MIRSLLVAGLVLVVGCSGDGDGQVLGTMVTVPETVLTPSILTTVVTAPASAEGAVLSPVDEGGGPVVGNGDPCAAIAGLGVVHCGIVEAGPGTVVWSLDVPRPGHPSHTATVWRVGTTGLVPVLRVHDPSGQRWVGTLGDQIDLNDDGVDEIVFAFREAGSSGFVQLDVIDAATATVVHHRSIDGGRLDVSGAGIVFWEASRGPDDPVCCPSIYDEWIMEVAPGPLSETLVAAVASGEVPEGDLTGP